EARVLARENVELNEAIGVSISDQDISEVTDKFQIVVANIMENVLLEHYPQLTRVTQPGGYLIFSGIYSSSLGGFILKWTTIGEWKLLEHRTEGEWITYCFQKKAMS